MQILGQRSGLVSDAREQCEERAACELVEDKASHRREPWVLLELLTTLAVCWYRLQRVGSGARTNTGYLLRDCFCKAGALEGPLPSGRFTPRLQVPARLRCEWRMCPAL